MREIALCGFLAGEEIKISDNHDRDDRAGDVH